MPSQSTQIWMTTNNKTAFWNFTHILLKKTWPFFCLDLFEIIRKNTGKAWYVDRNAPLERISNPLWALPLFSGMSVKGEILDWMGSDFLRLWSCCGLVDELDVVYTQFIFYKDHFKLELLVSKNAHIMKMIYSLSMASSHWAKARLILIKKGV